MTSLTCPVAPPASQAAAASDMQMQLKLKRLEREKNDLARQVATRTEQLEEQEQMMLAQVCAQAGLQPVQGGRPVVW